MGLRRERVRRRVEGAEVEAGDERLRECARLCSRCFESGPLRRETERDADDEDDAEARPRVAVASKSMESNEECIMGGCEVVVNE